MAHNCDNKCLSAALSSPNSCSQQTALYSQLNVTLKMYSHKIISPPHPLI